MAFTFQKGIDPKLIPIDMIARSLGLQLGKGKGNEVVVRCPLCDDKHMHMSLNTEKNTYRCNRCGSTGGVLNFYAKLNNCDTKEAYQEIINNNYPEYIYKKREVKEDSNPIAPLEQRDAVFNDLLNMLNLTDMHKMDLMRRGLSIEVIERNQYKSIPQVEAIRKRLCRILQKNHSLIGIPGFFEDYHGEWDFYSLSGYLIPARDEHRKIQGMQVRKDVVSERETRFNWFSSRGFRNGTKSEGYVHVIGNNFENCYLTEGPLKGDISHELSGKSFICIPGVNTLQYMVPTINRLRVKKICKALDMDKMLKPEVMKAEARISDIINMETCVEEQMTFTWEKEFNRDHNIKGIDDYLYLRKVANK